MKYGIDIGHNVKPSDTGAYGVVQEDVLTKELGTVVGEMLVKRGHEVIYCTPASATNIRDSLQKRCDIANRNKVDLFVSFHFNAYNDSANGCEVFAISSTGKEYARAVLKAIITTAPFMNRGVKDGSRLFVLRKTNMPAILIETCFCDSQFDMRLYRENKEKIAVAIAEALLPKPSLMKIESLTDEDLLVDGRGGTV